MLPSGLSEYTPSNISGWRCSREPSHICGYHGGGGGRGGGDGGQTIIIIGFVAEGAPPHKLLYVNCYGFEWSLLLAPCRRKAAFMLYTQGGRPFEAKLQKLSSPCVNAPVNRNVPDMGVTLCIRLTKHMPSFHGLPPVFITLFVHQIWLALTRRRLFYFCSPTKLRLRGSYSSD